MNGLTIVGWLVAVIAVAYIIFLQLELRNVWRQLSQIRQQPTNAELRLSSKSPIFIKLAVEINELLRQNKETYQEMQRSSEQFDVAINNIAHDLRTPLTVASGYSQYLSQHQEIDQMQEADLLGKINTNLKDVEGKLEELLTYNRISEQQVEVVYERVNLSKVLEEQLFNYFETFKEKEIELEVAIEPNVTLVTDCKLVTRIIQNALGNILTHGEQQAAICLVAHEKELTLTFSNQTSQVITNYDRLFDRFYTEDLSRKGKNAGLGLYIIKELSTLIGGTVELGGVENSFDLTIVLTKESQK